MGGGIHENVMNDERLLARGERIYKVEQLESHGKMPSRVCLRIGML